MNSQAAEEEAERLFRRLEKDLADYVDPQYFEEPRKFKSLFEVVKVLGHEVDNENMVEENFDLLSSLKSGANEEYQRLFGQQEAVASVIEDVVQFEHGLSNSVDTMGDVVRAYASSREDIRTLRGSLLETQSVLNAKKSGTTPLKELWMKKTECEETLRILNEMEKLKDAPLRVDRFIKENKFLNAVLTLNTAIENMFNEDLIDVVGLSHVRTHLMELKETIMEKIVGQLKNVILFDAQTNNGAPEFRDDDADSRSDGGRSLWGGTMVGEGGSGGSFFSNGTSGSFFGGNSKMMNNTLLNSAAGRNFSGGSFSPGPGESEAPSKFVVSRIISIGVDNYDSRMELLEELSWSMDLFEDGSIDAAFEDSIQSPELMGSVYTRLLVRAVGALHCEEDVNRMLISTLMQKQFNQVVKLIKEWAMMSHQSSGNQNRKGGIGANSNGNGNATGASSASTVEAQRFSKFVRQMLNSAYMSLKRLLYVLRLLHFMKKAGEDGIAVNSNPITGIGLLNSSSSASSDQYEMKASLKTSVLKWWKQVEEVVIGELNRHFVEKEVTDIMDVAVDATVNMNLISPDRNNRAGADGDDCSPSNGFSVPTETQGEDDDGDESEVLALVCNPTSKLAAPVYRDITIFTDKSKELLQEEVDWDLSSVTGTKIITFVHDFIDAELMPVIQGSVNQVMRDLQTNTQFFSLPSVDARRPGGSGAGAAGGQSLHSGAHHSESLSGGHTSKARSEPSVCLASQMCAKRAKPLFIHWLQLPQHRDSVATILERMIRGYASSAREEVDAFTWRWMSSENVYKNAVTIGIKADPLFTAYRQHMYDGRASVDEYMGGSGSSSNSASSRYSTSRKTNPTPTVNSAAIAQQHRQASDAEMAAWGALWDVGNATAYAALSSDKVSRDFGDITSVAAITHGCDWLTSQLCRGCVTISKKVSSLNKQSKRLNSSTNSLRFSSTSVNGVSSSVQASSVWYLTKDAIKDLSKLAEEGLSLLRAEVQVACFNQLHQFAHLKLGSGISEEPEGIVVSLYQHLLAYQDAVLSAMDPEALAIVFSPICILIPRLLLRYLQHIAITSSYGRGVTTDFHRTRSNMNPHGGGYSEMDHYDDDAAYADQVNHDKTHILRAMVACQQSVSMLIESSHFEGTMNKTLQEVISDEFERVRRYVTLMDMPMIELKAYIANNFNDYSFSEYEALWMLLKDKPPSDISFEKMWNAVASRKNMGMGPGQSQPENNYGNQRVNYSGNPSSPNGGNGYNDLRGGGYNDQQRRGSGGNGYNDLRGSGYNDQQRRGSGGGSVGSGNYY